MSRPPPHVHGKEGVDGSSPSEGFIFSLLDAFSVDGHVDSELVRCPRSVHTVDVALDCIAVAIEAGLTASV